MKKTILTTTFLIAGIIGVLAQGSVSFSNSPFDPWPDSGIDRLVYQEPELINPITDSSLHARLYQNPDVSGAGIWTPAGDSTAFLGNVGGTFTAGIWQFVGRVLNVPAGTATTLKVAVLDGPNGNILAESPEFGYTPPTGATPPPDALLMVNFRAFGVPEPSTVALGVLGIGALLLFRRRK
jgi:hypothetical protein